MQREAVDGENDCKKEGIDEETQKVEQQVDVKQDVALCIPRMALICKRHYMHTIRICTLAVFPRVEDKSDHG